MEGNTDLPQIPTDNPYKFVSIFDILLAVGSVTVPLYFDHQMHLEKIRADADVHAIQELMASIGRLADLEAESRALAGDLTPAMRHHYVVTSDIRVAEIKPSLTIAEGKQIGRAHV